MQVYGGTHTPVMAMSVRGLCGQRFESLSSASSARAMLSRHRRELHGTRVVRGAVVKARRKANREYMQAARGASPVAGTAMAVDLRVFVLCPLRRERQQGLYTLTRAAFLHIGVHPVSLVCLQGCDLQRGRLPRKCPRMFPQFFARE